MGYHKMALTAGFNLFTNGLAVGYDHTTAMIYTVEKHSSAYHETSFNIN